MTSAPGGTTAGPSPMAIYHLALRQAVAGQPAALAAVDERGRARRFHPSAWSGGLIAGDRSLLARCRGTVIDVGCGPGRLVSALQRQGHEVLGVDISAEVVRLARCRGAPVVCRDIFDPLPREGRWDRVLCTDGSIGIGGRPQRLLARCRRLLAPGGSVLAEVGAPGTGTWAGRLRLHWPPARLTSGAFGWAYVDADGVAAIAERAGLLVSSRWTEAGRWFVSLRPS